ncbi:hypothetical protein G7046_g5965 [Stylonectria norvegica]|nr:hypothetical protein G7046_g5965 [Stylonectria norvegica]
MAMTPQKRSADELSSSDDEAAPFPVRRVRRRVESPPHLATGSQYHDSLQQSFAELLANALPTNFVNAEVRKYLIWQSNNRLEEAREEGIALDEIYIGEDCLPVWPDYEWDPSLQSLHSVIQSRLADLQMAQQLGNLVRDDLIAKGNRKLCQARELGIDLQNIFVGKGLLPEWRDRMVVDLSDDEESEVGDSQETSDIFDIDSMASSFNTTPETPTIVRLWDSHISALAHPIDTPSTPHFSSAWEAVDSDWSSDSSSDEDSFCGDDGYDMYPITLNNAVDDQAYFSDDPSNIFHDAEVVGGRRGYSDVDLEVYLADDDDEVHFLPELELAIDRTSYEYWYGTDEAVDVELPGMDVRCNGEIFEIVEVSDEELEEDTSSPIQTTQRPNFATMGKEREALAKALPRQRQESVADTGMQDHDDAASIVSEEVTDDEDTRPAVIRDTEDGFVW